MVTFFSVTGCALRIPPSRWNC